MTKGDFLAQIKTRDNVRFEEPLKQIVTLRITEEEFSQLNTVAHQSNISTSELMRNILREHIGNYAMSENLIKYLSVSNEIDKFLLEKRLISSRKATNLSKIREILTDFEVFLDQPPKLIDKTFAYSEAMRLNGLVKFIFVTDEWLGERIELQIKRIWKTKGYKSLKIVIEE